MKFFVVAALLLTSCSAPPPVPLSLTPIDFSDVPAWESTNHDTALAAFRQSCRKFASHPQTLPSIVADKASAPVSWNNVCLLAKTAPNAKQFFSEYFVPHQAIADGTNDTGLLTGYYEPMLQGALTQSAKYRYPLWGLPSDWNNRTPYLTRKQIDQQGLSGKAKPVLWLADNVDRFFLHIQGSGIVQLPDGNKVKVAFAGKNNRPYTGIGKYLLDRKIVPPSQMSAPLLKNWLRKNPQQGQQAMWMNESYIFFKRGDSNQGAVGAQGVPLTSEASIAVDPTMLPYGVPVVLDTHLPYTNEAYRRLVIAQDTGSAIKGALRADLFFGPGKRAEHLAGGMKQQAKFYILLPKQ